MGSYLFGIGGAMLLLMVVYEYGWPPIEMFDTLLRTEKSRTIARVVGWGITLVLAFLAGLRLWFIFR